MLKMKICYVYCHTLAPNRKGFSEQHPCRLAQIMGIDAMIYAAYAGVADEKLFGKNGVIPVNINSKLLSKGYLAKFIGLIVYTFKIGRDYKIDIFMNVWSHYLMLPVWIGAKLSGSQAVASLGGLPINKEFIHKSRNFKNRFVKKIGLSLEWCSLRVVPRIHSVSYALKLEFVSRGVPVNKIQVISRGIDTDLFRIIRVSKKNKKNKDFHLGTVSRLSRVKDVETIIEAMAIITKKYPSICLHIAGDGNHKKKLMEIVCNKGLNDKVVFHGHLEKEKLFRFYAGINLFVLASVSEGIANVILEALACGLPVVATDVGDIPIHLDKERGFLFKVGDYEMLAKIIENVYLSNHDSEAIRRDRRYYVLRNHSYYYLTERYLDFFQSALKNKRTGK